MLSPPVLTQGQQAWVHGTQEGLNKAGIDRERASEGRRHEALTARRSLEKMPAEQIGAAELNNPGWRGLVRRITRITSDPVGAEDVVQSAMVRMLEYRRANVLVNPEAFVARAAVNLAIDERRQRARRPQQTLHHISTALIDGYPLQDEALRARERLARLKQGLTQLSPRTREIFLLHRLEGLKYREIAERLDITVSAVEKHVPTPAHFLTEWTETW